jgi:serine protease Do
VPNEKNNLPAQRAQQAVLHNMAANGQIGSSLQALNDQWARDLASDPNKYAYAGRPVHAIRTSVAATCSGWFVTPTGYLVTAAHCVTKDSTITDGLASNVLPRYIDHAYKSDLARWKRQSIPVDQTIHSELRAFETKWYEQNSGITHTSVKATVALGIRGKNGQRSQRALPARIVSHGTPYPGEDFALLKVSGQNNLPTMPLGNESKLEVGDNLYIDGFPGTVTDSNLFTQQSRLQPTFTDGLLSAFRTTNKNIPYLQTQAPAFHGNSGGPVLDANGNVVGTLIAGAADPNTGQLVAGEQFVLPASVITHLLASQHVTPQLGAVTKDYDAALRDYFNGYYTWALAGFRRVLAAFPGHPYAAQYARLAQQQIAAGHDRTPKGSSFPWLAVGIAAAAVVIGAALAALARRRRARRAAGQWPPPPSANGPAWPPPPPPRPAVPQPIAPAGGAGWPQPPPGQPAMPQPPPGQPAMPQPPPGQPAMPQPPPGQPAMPQVPPGQLGVPQVPPRQPAVPQPSPGQFGPPQPLPGQPAAPRPTPAAGAAWPSPPGQPGVPQPTGPVGNAGRPPPAPRQPAPGQPAPGQPAPGQPAPPPGGPAWPPPPQAQGQPDRPAADPGWRVPQAPAEPVGAAQEDTLPVPE